MTSRLVIVAVLAALSLPAAAGGAGASPETTITAGPVAVTNDTSASFAFRSDDPTARFACALDSAAFSDCTSPSPVSAGDGVHHFLSLIQSDAADD